MIWEDYRTATMADYMIPTMADHIRGGLRFDPKHEIGLLVGFFGFVIL
jgi:hypothetical protein